MTSRPLTLYERDLHCRVPLRWVVRHSVCGAQIILDKETALMFARGPQSPAGIFCTGCNLWTMLLDGDGNRVFFWADGTAVGE